MPFRYYLLFMPIGLLMLLLPISVSGFGLPQGVIVWLLRPLGVAGRAVVRAVDADRPDGPGRQPAGLLLWFAGEAPNYGCGLREEPGNPVES